MKKAILTMLVMVFITTLIYAQWDIEEGFEGGTFPPTGWSVINNSGTNTWVRSASSGFPHTGTGYAYLSDGLNAADDWLITPQVSIQSGDEFIFWSRLGVTMFSETFEARLSTTGNAVADFTVTLGSETVTSQTYTEYVYDLSSYTGNVYLAIRGTTSMSYQLFVDDVKIGQDDPLPVVLSTFAAVYSNGDLSINWVTQSESNNIGWNIYRAESDNLLESMKINSDLIPGAGTVCEPTEYSFVDQSSTVENSTYWYWLESRDGAGITENYGPISFTVPMDDENSNPPDVTVNRLYNYPNPFNPTTTISFEFIEDFTTDAEIIIYNIKGQEIKQYSIFNNQSSIIWDGTDENNQPVSSGIYFYKLDTGRETITKKMLLLE
ncbi:MAG: choice-of-anchor J domain-containing protein [Candidatus Cloacimonetes bacterium]|nr:choice-of-anchor J domain-containing protein [Candidatus Cloacimonadota bacterium]